MNERTRRILLVVALGCLVGVLLVPGAARAYGGPGSVVTGIGALLAVLAAVVASVFGFVWFPVKRLVAKLREGDEDAGEGSVAERAEGAPPE